MRDFDGSPILTNRMVSVANVEMGTILFHRKIERNFSFRGTLVYNTKKFEKCKSQTLSFDYKVRIKQSIIHLTIRLIPMISGRDVDRNYFWNYYNQSITKVLNHYNILIDFFKCFRCFVACLIIHIPFAARCQNVVFVAIFYFFLCVKELLQFDGGVVVVVGVGQAFNFLL